MTLLEKIQTNTQASIKEFENSCDELANAKYIIAEAKISKVLQSIVANTKLYTLMGQVCNGFDPIYVLNMHAAKTEDGNNTVLPPSDEPLCVGFVFRLLYLLDTEKPKPGNERILMDFLSRYYNQHDLNLSMLEFGLLIKAFKQNALHLIAG